MSCSNCYSSSFLFMAPGLSTLPSWIHIVVDAFAHRCSMSCYLHPSSPILLFFPLSTSPFYPKTRLANLPLWPRQCLFVSLLLLNHLIWWLVLTRLPKGPGLLLRSPISYAANSFFLYRFTLGALPLNDNKSESRVSGIMPFCVENTSFWQGVCITCIIKKNCY